MEFNSFFKEKLQLFIMEKKSMGLKYKVQERILQRFDRFLCDKYPSATVLDADIIGDWCRIRKNEHPGTVEGRVVPVRCFCKYLQSIGIDAYVFPKGMLPKIPVYQPYIYTKNELQQINQSADRMKPLRGSRYIHLVMPSVLRILQGCGTRIGETICLKFGDVDLDRGIITIQSGKMGKSRLVPMASSLCSYLTQYKNKIPYREDEDWFFPSKNGHHVCHSAINRWFQEILQEANIISCRYNIRHNGRNNPRIHDFRHTFAVYCMKSWVEQNKDLRAYLPVLQAYMGHSSINNTAYYLHLTADLYPDITEKVHKAFGDIIPSEAPEYENN